MVMKNPAHPGRIVKSACLEELGLSVTKAAIILDVTRPTLSRIINCKSGISAEMAVRLTKAFGGTPEAWLRMQAAYDLSQIEKHASAIKVTRYHSGEAIL
ncbi:MAG: HigA family addiction module antitoxin [Alphaproteobacteria bacterium]|nr:HigA family addiction module antitoxin [Alphaproteobacteria bacterium]